ncbi:MAG: peptidylprolyl isomerase [Pyrinomonadaceae bacterium]
MAMIFSLQSDLTRKLRAASALLPCLLVIASATNLCAQEPVFALRAPVSPVPRNILLRVVRAEDERRWDADLNSLLWDQTPSVRERAVLAAGRIGDERAVPALISVLQKDKDESVRAMAAFALGETESEGAAEALLSELVPMRGSAELRARIMEALGKIAAAIPSTEAARARSLGDAILGMLKFENESRTKPDRLIVLPGLTAILRARPEGAGRVLSDFLASSDPRIRADAANALARLRAKDGNEQLRKLLISDPDPIVRANAARVLGATEDKAAFDALLNRALKDHDSRVRVSAIRSLGSLKDARAADALLARGEKLYSEFRSLRLKRVDRPSQINEVLEIVVALGRVRAKSSDKRTVEWLKELGHNAPEVWIAFARIDPAQFADYSTKCCPSPRYPLDVPNLEYSSSQAWAELAPYPFFGVYILKNELCLPSLDGPKCSRRGRPIALPEIMRAYAAFKSDDVAEVLRRQFGDPDVIVRATAAELLGELPPDEANARALREALPVALRDIELNDAALAILDALGKQKSSADNEAIRSALDSQDHLIRRRAVALLKANGAGDFSARISTVQTRNTQADYERAVSRIGKDVRAVVSTTKGVFTIKLLPEDAPLNVDSFVELAKREYFKGISFHRVVPNFVIQGGDPRGDGNGGPGYSVRCEINQVPYERGAVGMALSGKDTGGSQWFVTHSPQPHLDGGYTVFGRVIAGIDVVDRITRGDIIRSVVISEGRGRVKARSSTEAKSKRRQSL